MWFLHHVVAIVRPMGTAPRRFVALVAALVFVGPVAPGYAAEGEVERAEAAVQDAQRKANAANQGLQAAEAALDDAEGAVVKGTAELKVARRRLDEAAAAVRASAVREYTSGRAATSLKSDDIVKITRSRAYLGVATGASADQVDQLRALASDLEDRERNLNKQVSNQRAKLAAFQRLEGQLASSLDRLGTELGAARRREAEAKAAAAAAVEAAEKARLEAEARAAEAARRLLEETRDREARAARPAPSAGPGPQAAPVNKGPWVCPVQGGATFTNDWGFPRSGGRRHQGNDLFAARGTPWWPAWEAATGAAPTASVASATTCRATTATPTTAPTCPATARWAQAGCPRGPCSASWGTAATPAGPAPTSTSRSAREAEDRSTPTPPCPGRAERPSRLVGRRPPR